MNNKFVRNTAVFLLLFAFALTAVYAEGGKKERRSLTKANGEPAYTKININRISTWIKDDGETNYDPQAGASGLDYPTLSNQQAVFQSGFVWGADIINDLGDTVKYVGGSTYQQGCLPGNVTGTPGNTTVMDPSDADARIYRVRPDYATADVSVEAQDEGSSESSVRAQYQTDWEEWPADMGAIYNDVDGNGSYDPNVDIPGFPGADQTVYAVWNDFDAATVAGLYGSTPMKVEVQATIWAYNRDGALGNMIFRAYQIINYNTKPFYNMYVSWWSDPDLGNAGDDYSGCDTNLSLAFTYNGVAQDGQYGFTPPAAGFDFFQGPTVDAPGDSAIFKNTRIYDKMNLPMTAHYFFINGDPVYTDPDLGNYQGTLEFHNLFRGKISTTGSDNTDPLTGQPTKFALAGDPVTGSGWIDGILHPPGDRRQGSVSGPFTMAPGDTQEIVIAEIVAGAVENVTNIDAVALLKFYDETAQFVYDNFFQVANPPLQPKVNVSELDQKIVLNWGWDLTQVNTTESHNDQGYEFEGYNVYQLPTATSSKDEGKRLVTYDVAGNGVLKIIGDGFDVSSGTVLQKVLQFGGDYGIQRYFEISTDALGNAPLRNGSRYYFAVTAYAYNPNAVPLAIENPIAIITVIPQGLKIGERFASSVGNIDTATHAEGNSDGLVSYQVVSPDQTTGHTYRMNFTGPTGNTTWTLTDETTGEVKLANVSDESPDPANPIVDGLQIFVEGASQNYKNIQMTANANGVLATPDGATADWYDWAHAMAEDAHRPTSAQQANGSTWLVHSVRNTTFYYTDFFDATTQYTGGFGEPDMGIGSMIPDDYEFRFTAAGDEAFYNWTTGDFGPVPFEVWNTQGNADPSDDFKVLAYILDNDADGTFNLSSVVGFGAGATADDADHDISGADNDPYTDAIYLVQPLDETPGTKGFDDLVALMKSDLATASAHVLWAYKDATYNSVAGLMRLSFVNWNGGDVTGDGSNYNAQMPEVGSIIKITLTKPNSTNDVFRFTAPSVTYDQTVAAEDAVDEINVFPNPYYGTHSEELNKYQRFVTFSHLPQNATLRIFNLAGQLVKVIEKSSTDQFQRWDLTNEDGLPAASGLYIAYIEMPDLGVTKTLKFSIIQEQQFLDRF